MILPNVVQSVANLLSSSSGPIDGPDISERCRHRLSIVRINVTLNVTLGYLASSTNVTLGLQRFGGNVTLPGRSPVDVTEEADRPGDRLLGRTSAFPRHRPVAVPYAGPVRRGPVRGRTPFRVATHDGSGSSHRSADRESAPAGIEPATAAGRPSTSAPPKRYGTGPHLCII